MAGISQTIPNYYGGISKQPDQLKNPGQVKDIINGIPDITYGIYKRPGAKRIGVDKLTGVAASGSWFHYHRDTEEGSYVGQIGSDGTPKVWKVSGDNPGAVQTIAYGSTASADETNLKTYLTPSPNTDTEDIQFCTINDTTFINNRSKAVTIASETTTDRPHTHCAFVELLRTENGRQYGLNVYSSETATTLKRATRLEINSDTLGEDWGSGACAGTGTQVFSASEGNSSGLGSGNGKNLIFRLTILGQTGESLSDDGGTNVNSFRCTYNRNIDLLHGGEGWDLNDDVSVTLDQAKGGDDSNLDNAATYTIKVIEHEAVDVKGTINGGVNGIIRPTPTPFDAQCAVTSDTIIGGIITELDGTGLSATQIGTGIYLSSSSAFSVEICAPDLMRVMQEEVNDVSKLPTQCKDGYIIKVANAQMSDEDDYYMKFIGNDGNDGPGSWIECAKPGIRKHFSGDTMPVTLKRTALANPGTDTEVATFTLDRFTWDERTVGDDTTNPIPSFVSRTGNHPNASDNTSSYINKILFFRNRLTILSGPNVITSQPGDLGNFWKDTALTVSNRDSIDISSSSTMPSALYDGIEINTGLVAFSTNSQYLLSSDDAVFNSDTAKLRNISSYNYHEILPPISLGSTLGFIDNSNQFARFNEMGNIAREGQPILIDQTKVVPDLLPKDLNLIAHSKENGLILLGKTGTDTIYGYKYLVIGDQRLQSAWFKWKLNTTIQYHFIINDEYFFVDDDDFLQKISLVQDSTDLSIDDGTGGVTTNFLIHLDNWTTFSNGIYNNDTKVTSFDNKADWIPSVTSPNGKLVVVDTKTWDARRARYAEVTLTGNDPNDDFTLPGNWDWSDEWFVPYTDINTSNEQITLTSGDTDHNLTTGDPLTYYKGDTVAGGLINSTIYYAIRVDKNIIKLATNLTNANAGTAVNITSQGTGKHRIQSKIQNLNIGYLYDYQVDLPRIFPTKQSGQNTISDTNSSLTIHRVNLNFGKVGLYETTLSRLGKDAYTELYESTPLNEYEVSDAPYLAEDIRTVTVYDRNTNVDITLKSTHPSPATLRSMSWEGDYSPMYYRRA